MKHLIFTALLAIAVGGSFPVLAKDTEREPYWVTIEKKEQAEIRSQQKKFDDRNTSMSNKDYIDKSPKQVNDSNRRSGKGKVISQ